MSAETSDETGDDRLRDADIDEDTFPTPSPDMRHERRVAIHDLLRDSSFRVEAAKGPYALLLRSADTWLMFHVADADGSECAAFGLAMSSFRRLIRDYHMLCESYDEAIRNAPPAQIEAIDMGRRGLHDEGGALLRERLSGKAEIGFATARRLFTLICVLHRRRGE